MSHFASLTNYSSAHQVKDMLGIARVTARKLERMAKMHGVFSVFTSSKRYNQPNLALAKVLQISDRTVSLYQA